MQTIIYTSFDCLIKGKDFSEVLETNQHLDLENESYIDVYPIKNSSRPAFHIDIDIKETNFYHIIEKDNKRLIFLLDGIIAKSVKIFHLSTKNACTVEVHKNQVVFSTHNNKKIFSFPQAITSSSCGECFHIGYALLSCQTNDICILFNTENNNSKILKGKKISVLDNKIGVFSSIFGYSNFHEHYLITEKGLQSENKNISTLSNLSDHTLALRFLNAISLADFDTARSMLTPTLKNMTKSTIKEYFGTLSNIVPLSPTQIFALSNGKAVIYCFTIENGTISEINDEA